MGIHPPKAIPRLMFVLSKIRFKDKYVSTNILSAFEIDIIKHICYVGVFHIVVTPSYGHS